MKKLLSTKEVAGFLNINEKMVYTLVAEKGLPATKITGKWLFPKHLVEQWVEANTINYPKAPGSASSLKNLLIIAGSNDPLLDQVINHFNSVNHELLAVFGNLGSLGGLKALKQNLCHIASSHLIEENESEYNFGFASKELNEMPAVVNFCRREQGILVQKQNPKKIACIADFANKDIKIANRPLSTGTRVLLDHELKKADINCNEIKGYTNEFNRHLDVGLEILSDRADAGLAIRAVAGILDLDFIPLRWERYDLLISKELFFAKNIQRFLGTLNEPAFKRMAKKLHGYDISMKGEMVFPKENG